MDGAIARAGDIHHRRIFTQCFPHNATPACLEGTLDIARIEAGKLTLNPKPMAFSDGMHEMAGMFELQAAAKGLRFDFEVSGNLPEMVRADEKRVRQIVINLLGNAIKFTAQGQVTFKMRYAKWRTLTLKTPGRA